LCKRRTARIEEMNMPRTQPDGHLVPSATGTGNGVLVLHAWWGLNDTMKAFCTRLADSGFTVFAPDLYHGQIAGTIGDAEALANALDADADKARADISDATDFLAEQAGQADRSIAVVGFSLGAAYALDLSISDPERIRSVVLFYGTGPGGDLTRSKAAYLGHFAETDEFEPLSGVDALETALKGAGRPVTFHRYPDVRHWFFEPDRPQAFNAEAARLAWDRTVEFLREPPTS
jgi:carboxymethylenebutenolidase